MSYCFSAKGSSKTDALLDAETKFEKVCTDMPVHGLDKGAVMDNLRAAVNLAREPQSDEVVHITLSGYIVVANPAAGPSGISTVSINCAVGIGPDNQAS